MRNASIIVILVSFITQASRFTLYLENYTTVLDRLIFLFSRNLTDAIEMTPNRIEFNVALSKNIQEHCNLGNIPYNRNKFQKGMLSVFHQK